MAEHDEVTVLLGPTERAVRELRDVLGVRQAILDTIDSAERQLLIACYMLNGEELVERICGRSDELKVTIHLDEKQTSQYEDARAAVHRLRRAGALVHLHSVGRYQSMHAKVVIADRRQAVVGSANLTNSGQDRNFELGLLLRGPSVGILLNALRLTLGADVG